MTPTGFDWSIDPECSLGYSEAQLRAQLDDRYPAFAEYMLMKAHAVCPGPVSAASGPPEFPERACETAHGHVYYVHDVLWFVEKT